MGTTSSTAANAASQPSAVGAQSFSGAADRRRRKRAKISAQVHVKATDPTHTHEEICTSVDVSRDGLLFTSARAGYAVGQSLDVTFPYSAAASALNKSERAEIVRVTEQSGRFAIAIQFMAARGQQYRAVGQAVSGPSPLNAQASPSSQQPVVLAVEPDPRTAEIMRGILQQDGYNIIIVSTANEALEILKSTVPAVFVAEVEAKDMSGHDLCLIVKRNERLQRVPVILLTRSAQPADYAASHQLGAVVCMAKPFKPERLLHVVRLVAPPPAQKNAYGARVSNNSIERAI
jgi:CheY-like chemotaxis protein